MLIPLTTTGGLDMRHIRPSGLTNMHPDIWRTLVNSRLKHESVVNCELLRIVPKISVAPKDVFVKSHALKFES